MYPLSLYAPGPRRLPPRDIVGGLNQMQQLQVAMHLHRCRDIRAEIILSPNFEDWEKDDAEIELDRLIRQLIELRIPDNFEAIIRQIEAEYFRWSRELYEHAFRHRQFEEEEEEEEEQQDLREVEPPRRDSRRG